MAKIRTLDQLQDCLDIDFGWRIKEILTIKMSISKSSGLPKNTLIRAGIAILYAHWEGFIKASSVYYAEYILNKALRYNELKPCFIILGLRGKLELISSSRKSQSSMEALTFIQSKLNEQARFNLATAIDTESNLSSSVFDNIVLAIGLDTTNYNSYYNLIDESLVNRRNKIAHGEYLDINIDEWKDLADKIVMLMRSYKTDVQNAATLCSYKAA